MPALTDGKLFWVRTRSGGKVHRIYGAGDRWAGQGTALCGLRAKALVSVDPRNVSPGAKCEKCCRYTDEAA